MCTHAAFSVQNGWPHDIVGLVGEAGVTAGVVGGVLAGQAA